MKWYLPRERVFNQVQASQGGLDASKYLEEKDGVLEVNRYLQMAVEMDLVWDCLPMIIPTVTM